MPFSMTLNAQPHNIHWSVVVTMMALRRAIRAARFARIRSNYLAIPYRMTNH